MSTLAKKKLIDESCVGQGSDDLLKRASSKLERSTLPPVPEEIPEEKPRLAISEASTLTNSPTPDSKVLEPLPPKDALEVVPKQLEITLNTPDVLGIVFAPCVRSDGAHALKVQVTKVAKKGTFQWRMKDTIVKLRGDIVTDGAQALDELSQWREGSDATPLQATILREERGKTELANEQKEARRQGKKRRYEEKNPEGRNLKVRRQRELGATEQKTKKDKNQKKKKKKKKSDSSSSDDSSSS